MSVESREKTLAISTLCAICKDATSPATARASAARTLLEVCGEIGRLQTEKPNDDKGLHEMSRAELDAELRRLSSAVSSAASNVKKRARSDGGAGGDASGQKARSDGADGQAELLF
jgi:hypothetical protein